MSESQVIARKYRPQSFNQVVGQEAITRTLANAIKSKRIHHAYLFTGARGVGKTTTARILAKALNCQKGPTPEPCGVCASCVEITNSASIDVHEIDAASHTGVENVREVIIQTIQIAPARDRYKIFIIDEVHQLSGHSFNALLKTLEEPPPHAIFILATTELYKVPETILSRCQVFEFKTITLKRIFEQLKSIAADLGVRVSDSALMAVARAGDGSMRDAESALDQVISFAGKDVTDEDISLALGLVDADTLNRTMTALAQRDSRQVLRIVEEVIGRGYDLRNFCRELMAYIRALLVTKIAGFDQELLELPPSEGETVVRLSEAFSEQDLLRFFSILTKTEQDIRLSSQPRLQFEIGLIKLVHAERLYMLEEALSRLQELESRLGGSLSVPPASSSAPQDTPRSGSSRIQPGAGSFKRAGQVAAERPAPPAAPVPAAPQPSPQPAPPKPVAKQAPPVEPPAILDEPYEEAYESAAVDDGRGVIERLKKALESRNKFLVLSAIEKAEEVKVEGRHLRVSLLPENSKDKSIMESKDNRRVIEEVAQEVFGRHLTLSTRVSGQPFSNEPQAESKPLRPGAGQKSAGQAGAGPVGVPQPSATKPKKPAVEHPGVQALVDKFHGEVLEVVKPET